MLDTLKSYGFTDRNSNVYVQCFDWQELTRIRDDLGCQLKLVQLIGENSWEESAKRAA